MPKSALATNKIGGVAMGACALCEAEWTQENRSVEHIIPNSIGGRKTTTYFICKDCNNKAGRGWDYALFKQLAPICSLAGISRQRGNAKPLNIETVSGKKYSLKPDGTFCDIDPVVMKSGTRENPNFYGRFRSIDEAKKILSSLKRKSPELDFDKLLNSLSIERGYLDESLRINLQFRSDAMLSLVKTASAYACHRGIPIALLDNALPALSGRATAKGLYAFLYFTDVIKNRPDRIFHCVSVAADPTLGKAYGYVEYFGFLRLVVLLSAAYKGPALRSTYALDPITAEELELDVDLMLKDDVLAAAEADPFCKPNMHAATMKSLRLLQDRGRKREVERLMEQANDQVRKLHPNDGPSLGKGGDEKEANKIIQDAIRPYSEHLQRQQNLLYRQDLSIVSLTRIRYWTCDGWVVVNRQP